MFEYEREANFGMAIHCPVSQPRLAAVHGIPGEDLSFESCEAVAIDAGDRLRRAH